MNLQNIRRREEWADRADRERRGLPNCKRPPVTRDKRTEQISRHGRLKYFDRNREYSLLDSEIHILGEVGKFRIVGVEDLAQLAYGSDRSHVRNALLNAATNLRGSGEEVHVQINRRRRPLRNTDGFRTPRNYPSQTCPETSRPMGIAKRYARNSGRTSPCSADKSGKRGKEKRSAIGAKASLPKPSWPRHPSQHPGWESASL